MYGGFLTISDKKEAGGALAFRFSGVKRVKKDAAPMFTIILFPLMVFETLDINP
jgi:hypothetical protein